MTRPLFGWLLLAAAVLLLPLPARAETAFELQGEMAGLSAAPHLMLLEDKDRALTIDDARNAAANFVSFTEHLPRGISSSAWWVRMTVHNGTAEEIRWLAALEHSQFNTAALYYFPSRGEPARLLLGRDLPMSQHPVKSLRTAFPLVSAPGETGTLYLRLAYGGTGLSKIGFHVWTPEKFEEREDLELVLLAIMLGGAVVLLTYNAFLAFAFRTPEYVWYVLYGSSATFMLLVNTGIGPLYLWANSAKFVSVLFPLAALLTFLCAAQLARSYLETRKYLPRADAWLAAVVFADLILILLLFAGMRSAAIIGALANIPMTVLYPVLGYMVWRRGKKEARFYIVAWVIWVAALIVGGMGLLSFIPNPLWTNFFTKYAFLAEALVLSFALADRINLLRDEKERTTQLALQHEQTLARIQSQKKEELELMVAARTRDLLSATEKLAYTLWETQAIIDTNPDIIYQFDANSRLVKWNRRLEEFTGLSAEELMGREALQFAFGEDRPAMMAGMEQMFVLGENSVEVRLLDKMNRPIPYFCNGMLLRNDRGEVTGFTGSGRNISGMKKAEAELRAAKEAAERATRAKDKFVNIVSHDLKSPLAGIVGLLKVLGDPAEFRIDDPVARDQIAALLNSAERLYLLVNRLLDVSRLQSGGIALSYNVIPTRQFIGGLIGRMAPAASGKGITLENAISEDHLICADPALLEEAVANLLSNALKFSPYGGTVRIHAPEERAGCIAVSDTGPGVEENYLPHLFKHEVRTTGIGTGGETGTGLGLPHAADIVAAHGGEIRVESKPGQGATFTVCIPFPPELLPEEPRAASAARR